MLVEELAGRHLADSITQREKAFSTRPTFTWPSTSLTIFKPQRAGFDQ